MRSEVGRVLGVEAWADGGKYVTIICTQGHKKRLIDRVRWIAAEDRGELYTAPVRVDDPSAMDPGTSAEASPHNYETKWRLSCSCGINAVLHQRNLNRLAEGLDRSLVAKLELRVLAAMLSSVR